MNFLSNQPRDRGAAALEYIIVSAFGVILSLFAVAFLGKLAKDKFEKIGEKTGVEIGNLDDFGM